MIVRCAVCHSPIFGGSCRCGKNVVRCPDCDGTGRQKVIELLSDQDGYMGYILKPTAEICSVCGGCGRVSVTYSRVDFESE